jgi:HD domain
MTHNCVPPTNEFILPTSDTAVAATEFSLGVAPEFIYTHSVRSYLFARELAAADGLRVDTDYDDELVYFSCVLHDLGATDHANSEQRFEVDGADAAATLLRENGVEEARVDAVWTAIALHTSTGLAHRFGPVTAIAQMVIYADIVGIGKELLPNGFADRVHELLPRHNLG